jgi:flavin-binding protein dodecin
VIGKRIGETPFPVFCGGYNQRRIAMSVYKIVELVGTSPKSWEEAAKEAIETSTQSLRDLRIAEVDKLDMRIENGKIVEYRVRVKLSFKYEGSN